MTRVSSLASAPVSVLVPSASAAQTRARLVMLFEPGGRMRPVTGVATGVMVMRSVTGGVLRPGSRARRRERICSRDEQHDQRA
jgi:hypothetical protein